MKAKMTPIKKEVFLTSVRLDTGPFTLEELIEEVKNTYKEQQEFYKDTNPLTSYTLEVETENDYGDTYARFNMLLYTMETDEQFKKRIETEEKFKTLEKQKKERQKALDADPEYQKFLELKNKFK